MDQDQATALVQLDYSQVLGRQPDAFGYTTLVPLLVAGYDPAAVRSGLVTGSGEAANLVTGLYQAELGRQPDTGGLHQYLSALAAGWSLGDVRTSIASSPEARINLSLLYSSVLGRPADAGGLAQFTLALGSGYALGDVRTSLATSTEAASLSASIYQVELGHAPTAADLSSASQRLAAGGPAQLRADLARSAEAQAHLIQAYQLNFGSTPSAATLAAQTAELSLGNTLGATEQAIVLRGGNTVVSNYGYSIPQQYSNTGSAQFISVYNSAVQLYEGTVTPVATPLTGNAATLPGGDTIVLDLQTMGGAPLSFTATLDGNAIGGATVTAVAASTPGQLSMADRVTLSGAFGNGLHDLHIQLTSAAPAGALIVRTGATFNGNAFLVGSVSTNAAGAVDIFPHAGPQPPLLYGR